MAVDVEEISEESEEMDDFTSEEMSASDFAMMLDDESMPTDEELTRLFGGDVQYEEDENEDWEDINPGELDNSSEDKELDSLEEDRTTEVEQQESESDEPATDDESPASSKHSSAESSQEEADSQPVESQQVPQGEPSQEALQSLLDQVATLLDRTEVLYEKAAKQSEQIAEAAEAVEGIQAQVDENTKRIEVFSKSFKKDVSQARVALRGVEKEFDKASNEVEVCRKKMSKDMSDMTSNAKASIGELANAARDHIQKLEQESMKRSQAYFQLNLPQKILNYMKWFGCIVVFVLAVAWILERVVG